MNRRVIRTATGEKKVIYQSTSHRRRVIRAACAAYAKKNGFYADTVLQNTDLRNQAMREAGL